MDKTTDLNDEYFAPVEKFLGTIEPRKIDPPFVSTDFSTKRKAAWNNYKKFVGNQNTPD